MASPRLLPGLVLVPCMTFVGFAVGGTAGSLLASGHGWDRLADALGGVMLGGVAGLALAAVLTARLGVEALRRTAWITLVLALLGVGALTLRQRLRQQDRPPDAPPGPPTAPVAPGR